MYWFPVRLNGFKKHRLIVYINFSIFYLYKLQITFLSKLKTETNELHALRTEAGITLEGQKKGQMIAANFH